MSDYSPTEIQNSFWLPFFNLIDYDIIDAALGHLRLKDLKDKNEFYDKLSRHQILGLVLDSPVKRAAEKFVENRFHADVCFLLITARLSDKFISEALSEAFAIELTEDVVRYIRNYYWDTESMSYTEMFDFCHDEKGRRRFRFAGELWAAYVLPPNLTLLRVGLDKYVSFDSNEAIDFLFKAAYSRAVECLVNGRFKDFNHIGQILVRLHELSKQGVISASELIEKLKQIKLKEQEPKLITLKQLEQDYGRKETSE